MNRRRIALAAALAAAIAVTIAIVVGTPARSAQCGAGFHAAGPRCCAGAGTGKDECERASTCPAPLVVGTGGDCVAPPTRVVVPETTVTIGPSDWEAEGLVAPRTVHVARFAIDAFELTRVDVDPNASDGARAASNLDLAQARALCAARGGRLPTEDEWIAAAATEKGRRYPWGDTGLVCRRAAFGLESGPCAQGATGPDTVGAHPDGDGALAIHDLAGNVAEWVEPRVDATPGPATGKGVLRGGSWRSTLAADLRIWSRAEVAAGFHDATTGARCAYDAERTQ